MQGTNLLFKGEVNSRQGVIKSQHDGGRKFKTLDASEFDPNFVDSLAFSAEMVLPEIQTTKMQLNQKNKAKVSQQLKKEDPHQTHHQSTDHDQQDDDLVIQEKDAFSLNENLHASYRVSRMDSKLTHN